MKLQVKVFPPTGKTHSGTVIFFHGSGDTGANLVQWVRFLLGRDMQFPFIKVMYPTAPMQPYTPMDGELSNVWFDRKAINIDTYEDRKSLSNIYKVVNELIDEEISNGIPPSRIIVGGFSMGGALALHSAYHLNTELGGVFACSSFLNKGSIVYDSIRNRKDKTSALPELLMFHGDRDSLVPLTWGQQTINELKAIGVDGEFVELKNTLHELKKRELTQLREWIEKKLPPLESDLANKL